MNANTVMCEMECPVCQQTIGCAHISKSDEFLSAHIASCQEEQEQQQTAVDRGMAAAMMVDNYDQNHHNGHQQTITLHEHGDPSADRPYNPTLVSAIHLGQSRSLHGSENSDQEEEVLQAYAEEPEQPPHKKKRLESFSFWIILSLIILVVLLIGGLVGAVVATRRDDDGASNDSTTMVPPQIGSDECELDPICSCSDAQVALYPDRDRDCGGQNEDVSDQFVEQLGGGGRRRKQRLLRGGNLVNGRIQGNENAMKQGRKRYQ